MKPCRCGTDGVRDIGAHGYCAAHLEQLYATFDRSVFAYAGVGVQAGTLRPDFGPHYANLACNACEATWVGVVGDPCEWCARSYTTMIDHRHDLVLTPPDVDPDDRRRRPALVAWAKRLEVAVADGTVATDEARRALEREQLRGARKARRAA